MRKKLISILLLVAMVISMLPATVFAVETTSEYDLVLSEDTIETHVGIEKTLTATVTRNGEVLMTETPAMEWTLEFTENPVGVIDLIAEKAVSSAGACTLDYVALCSGDGSIAAKYVDPEGAEHVAVASIAVKEPVFFAAADEKAKTLPLGIDFAFCDSVVSSDASVADAVIEGTNLVITPKAEGYCELTLSGADMTRALPVYVDAHHVVWQWVPGIAYLDVVKGTAAEEYDVLHAQTPAKPETENETFTFSGWDAGTDIVNPANVTNRLYTANYDAVAKTAKITWNVNGVTTEETYNLGATPAFTGSTDKASDASYSYEFTGWDPAITAVTGDQTYTAKYNQIAVEKPEAPVITLDKEVLELQVGDTQTLTAEANGAALVWTIDNEAVAIVADGVVTAVAAGTATITCANEEGTAAASCQVTVIDKEQKPAETFVITWIVDGKATTETYEKDAMPTFKGNPVKEGYIFSGWTPELAPVTKAQVYTAVFDVDPNAEVTYAITWVVDGNATTENVKEGVIPAFEGNTTKAGYVFKGWKPEVVAAAGNVTYTAQYEKEIIPEKHTVVWVVDGVLTTETYNEGDMPEFKGEPVKPGYVFQGWDPEVAEVSGDQIYTAKFMKEEDLPQQYKIVWMVNGAFKSETYTEGELPEYKGNTEMDGYVFAGWKPEVKVVSGNQIYTAQYTKEEAAPVQYTITWMVDGKTTTSLCNEGDIPVFNGSTLKDATVANTYEFAGWDKPVTACTGNITYVAKFIAAPRYYNVTWIVEDNEYTQSYAYGTTPVYAGEPEKESTNAHIYVFAGWDPKLSFVCGDATYTAVFQDIEVTYDITWKDHNGKTIRTDRVKYGEMPSFGADPKRPSENGVPYTFKGWQPAVVAATADASYSATYEKGSGEETYRVIFKDWNGKVLESQNVKPGSKPVYNGVAPTRETKDNTRYMFKGWEPALSSIKTVEEDLIFTAQYEASDAKELKLTKAAIKKNAADKQFTFAAYDFNNGTLFLTAETYAAMEKLDKEFVIRLTETERRNDFFVDVEIYELEDGMEIPYNKEIPGMTVFVTSLYDGDAVAIANDARHRHYENQIFSIVTEDGSYVSIPGACRLKTVANKLNFVDVTAYDWFFKEVHFAASHGVMIGTSATTFEPLTKVTRAQALQIAYRLAGTPEAKNGVAYDDFDPNGWYAKAAFWATANKMLPARSEKPNCFGINDVITREDQALLLYNVAKSLGMDCDEQADLNKFQDRQALSDADHVRAMEWAVGVGIINGRGANDLAPQGQTTRAEMAAMLSRYITYITIFDEEVVEISAETIDANH